MTIKTDGDKPDGGEEEFSPHGTSASSPATCMIALRLADFDRLVEVHETTLGQGRAEQFLFDECAKILSEARHASGILYDKFNTSKEQAHFTLPSADVADTFCQGIVERLEHRNATIANSDFHLKLQLGIAGYDSVPSEEQASREATRQSSGLAGACDPDEIWIAPNVYEMLSEPFRNRYGSGETSIVMPDGSIVRGRRRRVDVTDLPKKEKCVMIVDLAHFSFIQNMFLAAGGLGGAAGLQNQIKTILSSACAAAGSNYEEVCREFTGDGGIFVFEQPEQAHQVGIKILEAAEKKHNESWRHWKGLPAAAEAGMRCFRVGIAYGELSRDRQRKFAGPPISMAKRLESGGYSGELRISPEAYRLLPEAIRRLYGGEEEIRGKDHDGVDGRVPAQRLMVYPCAPWETQTPPSPPIENPEFVKKVSVTQKVEDCFVISPIDECDPRTSDVFKLLILPACQQLNFMPRRADQIVGPERMPVITDNLTDAPMAIAYLGRPAPGWNPDVMLEVGYRLSTGLPLVMISEHPQPDANGRIASLKELLPFHLVHKTIVGVPDHPQEAVARLAEEIKAVRNTKPHSQWNTTHPIIEYKFTNATVDLTLTEVSPEARALFDLDKDKGPEDLETMRRKFRERMEEPQHKAFRREQFTILRRIQDEATGLQADDELSAMPSARVPLVFKDQQLDGSGKPVGYLPVIVRYSISGGLIQLRMLYVKVSSSLRLDPSGHWVCDL